MDNTFGSNISTYTRAQAIEDGVLILLDPWMARAITIPVALTTAAWQKVVVEPAIIDGDGELVAQGMAAAEIVDLMEANNDIREIDFMMPITAEPDVTVAVRLVLHGGDNGEPVLTLMLAHED